MARLPKISSKQFRIPSFGRQSRSGSGQGGQVFVSPTGSMWTVTGVKKKYKLKRNAVRAGRRVAKRRNAELVVQKRNGRIAFKDSFGNDPFPPMG